jgi:hypothetical protein
MMRVQEVKRVSTQLEREPFRYVEDLSQAHVKIAKARLPEVLNPRPRSRVIGIRRGEAADRFERVSVEDRQKGIEVARRLQEW